MVSWGVSTASHHTHCCTLCIQWVTYLILSYLIVSYHHTLANSIVAIHVRVSTDPSYKVSTLSFIHTPHILTRFPRIRPFIHSYFVPISRQCLHKRILFLLPLSVTVSVYSAQRVYSQFWCSQIDTALHCEHVIMILEMRKYSKLGMIILV